MRAGTLGLARSHTGVLSGDERALEMDEGLLAVDARTLAEMGKVNRETAECAIHCRVGLTVCQK